MATSNTNDTKPTDKETFQHNLAPEPKGNVPQDKKDGDKARNPLDHDGDGKSGGAKKAEAPKKEENPAIERQQYQDKLEEEFRAKVEASRKDSPVDALGLPEGDGDELWSNAVEISPRNSETDEDGKTIKETDKDYDKRVSEGEAALVKGAIEFLSPMSGSLRPLGYMLTKTDTHIRLVITNTEANPDPAKAGGKPNELGRY